MIQVGEWLHGSRPAGLARLLTLLASYMSEREKRVPDGIRRFPHQADGDGDADADMDVKTGPGLEKEVRKLRVFGCCSLLAGQRSCSLPGTNRGGPMQSLVLLWAEVQAVAASQWQVCMRAGRPSS